MAEKGNLDWESAFSEEGGGDGGNEGAPSGGGSGGKGWVEGPPLAKMNKAALRRERDAIYADKNYLRDDQGMSYWARQKMIRRLTNINEAIGPEGPASGMEEELVRQGYTSKEKLEEEQEKFQIRDFEDQKTKAWRELEVTFGGPEGATEALSSGRKLIKQFGSPSLNNFLDSTGLGNDPRVIELAAEMWSLFEEGKQGKRKGRKR